MKQLNTEYRVYLGTDFRILEVSCKLLVVKHVCTKALYLHSCMLKYIVYTQLIYWYYKVKSYDKNSHIISVLYFYSQCLIIIYVVQ